MLKKILEDGVCPEEILNSISDEDKQLIFLEIRKEQIKRYKMRQQNYSEVDSFRQIPNKKGKNVLFISDIQLVSYLGERPGDKTIEEILKEEALKKAQLEAERVVQKEFESVKDPNLKTIDIPKIEIVPGPQPVVLNPIIEEPSKLRPTPPEIPGKPIMPRNSKSADQKRIDMVKRKSTELYQSYMNQITVLKETAEKENEEITKCWEMVEEQAKLDEEQRRKLAEDARILHAHINNDLIDNTGVPKTKPERPPRPGKNSDHLRSVINMIQKSNLAKSESDIKSWFLEHEWNKLRVFDGETDIVPTWFHGMITREETEELLDPKEIGTFLIRLSDKFQSYVLSYKSKGNIKHVLIECKPETNVYTFVGPTNVRSFSTLTELIKYFQSKPLDISNSDILTKPCGQKLGQAADYMQLLQPVCTNKNSATTICSL